MNSTIKIRKAVKDDLTRIFKLEEEAFKPQNYPLFALRQFFDISSNYFFVAEDDFNQIKGYAFGGINHSCNSGWIFALAVIKSEQKKKIGQHLTSKLITALKANSINKIQLTTTPDNIPAIKLYKTLGFKKVETDMNYYFDQSPRIIMSLKLH